MPIENPPDSPEEFERRRPAMPSWLELLKMEKMIYAKTKNIDPSNPGWYLAQNEILKQLRKEHDWNIKWASATPEDIEDWAKAYKKYRQSTDKSKNQKDFGFYLKLAKKNHQTAIENLGTQKALEQIKKDTFEDSARELEEIKKMLEFINPEEVEKVLLSWIENFKAGIEYQTLTMGESKDFNVDTKTLDEYRTRSPEAYLDLLQSCMDGLIKILKKKKRK